MLFRLFLLALFLAGCSRFPASPPPPTQTARANPATSAFLTVSAPPTTSPIQFPTNTPTPVPTIPPVTPSPRAASATPCQAYFRPVGFWPDERHLLGVSGVDGQSGVLLQKLDLDTLQSDTLAQLSADPEVLVLSPDGRALVYASPDHVLYLVSLPAMQLQAEFHGHTEPVTAASFSPQGDRLYTGSMDRSVRTWDLHGELLHTFEPPAADGLPSEVMGLALTLDGKKMVVIPGAGAPGLWRQADQRRLGEYPGIISGAYNGARAVFSPEGPLLAIGLAAGPGSVSLWRLADGSLLWQGGNLAFDLSLDGRYLAVTDPSGGGEAVEIRTGDGKNVERVFPQTFDPAVYRLFFSANSTRLAAVNDSLARVWQVEDGRLLTEYRPACP